MFARYLNEGGIKEWHIKECFHNSNVLIKSFFLLLFWEKERLFVRKSKSKIGLMF